MRHLDFIFLLLALCLFPFLLGRLLVPRAGQGSSLRASRERGHARAGGHAQAGRSDQGHTASRDEPVKKWPGLSVGATGLSLLSLPFLPFAIGGSYNFTVVTILSRHSNLHQFLPYRPPPPEMSRQVRRASVDPSPIRPTT